MKKRTVMETDIKPNIYTLLFWYGKKMILCRHPHIAQWHFLEYFPKRLLVHCISSGYLFTWANKTTKETQ